MYCFLINNSRLFYARQIDNGKKESSNEEFFHFLSGVFLDIDFTGIIFPHFYGTDKSPFISVFISFIYPRHGFLLSFSSSFSFPRLRKSGYISID